VAESRSIVVLVVFPTDFSHGLAYQRSKSSCNEMKNGPFLVSVLKMKSHKSPRSHPGVLQSSQESSHETSQGSSQESSQEASQESSRSPPRSPPAVSPGFLPGVRPESTRSPPMSAPGVRPDAASNLKKAIACLCACACAGSGKQEIANSQSQFDDVIHRA
jgi:hypothetical protein